MRRAQEAVRQAWAIGWGMTRAGVGSLATHWALAIFSLVTAFGVWMAVQDVENPQTRGDAPFEGTIPVEPVNVPAGYLVDRIDAIKIRVEAREDLFPELDADDFEATVDISSLRDAQEAFLPVQVKSRRDEVRVISAPEVLVRLVPAVEAEFPVTINRTEGLPATLEETAAPDIDPAFVTVRGRQELIDQVAVVRLDVNLSSARNETETFSGELAAYSDSGSRLVVDITPGRATATFKVRPLVASRQVDLFAVITGDPAPGFRVSTVVVTPATVLVTGPKAVIDGLRPPLNVETVDITNQTKTVTMTRRVEAPANTSVQPPTVSVRIEIVSIEGNQLRVVGITPEGIPAGLQLAVGTYTATVKLSGPQDQLNALKSDDVRVTVSLAGAVAGTASYPAKVTVPTGIRAEASPVTITLVPPGTP